MSAAPASDTRAHPVTADLAGAERIRRSRQPGLGLAGLAFVVPIAVLLSFGVRGAAFSTIVIGPPCVFSLALVAMIAFWWDDWPGTSLRRSWSGWVDTLLIALVAVGLTMVAQLLVGHFNLRGIFSSVAGAGTSPVFPITLPLGAAVFVVMLQLTLVCEGQPFRRLGGFVGGLAALGTSWAIAAALFFLLVDVRPAPGSGLTPRNGPLAPATLGAVMVLIGLWQAWFYIAWKGWPLSALTRRPARIVAGNVVVVAAALVMYAVAGAVGLTQLETTALAGSFIAATLVFGMLFDGWLPRRPGGGTQRLVLLSVILAAAAVLYGGLDAYARGRQWTTVQPVEWIGHVALNAISLSVILHVAVGRRWPFAGETA